MTAPRKPLTLSAMRKIIARLRTLYIGDRDPYARGYRQALRDVSDELKEWAREKLAKKEGCDAQ